MKNLGMSGATFSIVKRGLGVQEQGLYMREVLGPDVCPRVLRIFEDGYEMELCEQSEIRLSHYVQPVLDILRDKVWSHYYPPTNPYASGNWRNELEAWISARPYARHLLGPAIHLYDRCENLFYHHVHGDPTLANLMWRRSDDKLLISDPLPPGGKIPPLAEVDCGKILQSLVGWEHKLRGWHGVFEPSDKWISPSILQKSWFWCAVHLARAVPYCEHARRMDLADWVLEKSREIIAREFSA